MAGSGANWAPQMIEAEQAAANLNVSLPTNRQTWWGTWGPLVIAAVIFAVLSRLAGSFSEGFLEADSCTHYLYARFALLEPHYFVNVWGRPLCTGLYAIPAYLAGRLGVQWTSLLMAIGCAVMAALIARRLNFRYPALAGIFVLAQPLAFLHSFSELTELPFATLLAGVFLAYQTRRWLWFALLTGFLPLSRPEGFGFIVLAALALLAHRRIRWLPLLLVGLVLWHWAGWELYGRTEPIYLWLVKNWPYAADSVYHAGSPLQFVALLPAVTGPLIFPATVLGIWLCFRAGKLIGPDHVRRCEFLVAAIPLLILVGHSYLYWRGKMASSGELRYMLVVAPFWGLLAARGWARVFDAMSWPAMYRWAGAFALLPALVNMRAAIGSIHLGYRVLPLVLSEDWKQAQAAARWLQDSGIRDKYPKIMASHPGVFYALDTSQSGRDAREWKRDVIAAHPPGTVLIWDPMYSIYNADLQRVVSAEMILSAGWVEMPVDLGPGWRVFVSPQPATTPTTQP